MMPDLAQRLRARATLVGYWVASDNPAGTERIATAGYDYVCLDLQHGLIDYAGCLRGLTAVDAAGSAGVVRVQANDPAEIGRALDAGAQAVIVPLVNSAEEAARAALACRYPPVGVRSFGPMRSALRIGPDVRAADTAVACIVMIETLGGLEDLEAICAAPGVDGVYVGPSDLALALGAANPADGPARADFQRALERVRTVARDAGIAAGLHCNNGRAGAAALEAGFTFVSISNDLNHLGALARAELDAAHRVEA